MTVRSAAIVVESRLRLVVDPYNNHADDDVDTLLWRVGRMFDQVEGAHHWLDMRGVPRELNDGKLTLRGRLDVFGDTMANSTDAQDDEQG